jgi:hypothetical protein
MPRTNVKSSKATTVNYCKRPIRALCFVAITGMAASVKAGELGPASRGSVGISITIPPHLSIKPGHETNSQMSSAPGVCIQTNGLISLTMFNAGSSAKPVDATLKSDIIPATSAGSICHYDKDTTEKSISYWISLPPEQQAGSLMIVVAPN